MRIGAITAADGNPVSIKSSACGFQFVGERAAFGSWIGIDFLRCKAFQKQRRQVASTRLGGTCGGIRSNRRVFSAREPRFLTGL